MNILIDISKEDYEYLKTHNWDGLYNSILNGTPLPKGATNGDIIKAVFPNIDTNFSNVIDLKMWWNAKYKTESEE
jgi:hypothetical protein